LVAICAALLSVSTWLPWLTTSSNGGGHASAIGGTDGSLVLPSRFGIGQLIVLLSSVLIVAGAMAARELSPRFAAFAAVSTSMLIVGLTWYYYRLNVAPPVAPGYGLYVGAVCGMSAAVCSIWAAVTALTHPRPQPRPGD
jgi:hypothetical protein